MQQQWEWNRFDRNRAKTLLRVVAAESIYTLRTLLHRWEVKLDSYVASPSAQNSRLLRKELDRVSRLGDNVQQTDLNAALLAFPVPELSAEGAIHWEYVSLLERNRAEHALWRAARQAHPRVALRALEELDHFIPLKIRTQIGRIRSGQANGSTIAGMGIWTLPYLVKWLHDNHYSSGTHPALEQIGLLRDESALPYLQRLAGLVDREGAEAYGPLIHAAREAVRNIERAVIERMHE